MIKKNDRLSLVCSLFLFSNCFGRLTFLLTDTCYLCGVFLLFVFSFILFDHAGRLIGSLFPDQELNWGCRSESAESNPWTAKEFPGTYFLIELT